MIKKLLLGLVLLPLACPQLSSAYTGDGLSAAQSAFSHGRADDALRTLAADPNLNNGNASALNLQCRIYLAQGRWDEAISSCRHAVQLAPANSQYHLWLARAFGEKASRASMVSAYQTAKLAHAEFETAVSLDGQNREALSDLGEYYVEAPRILGGGYSKAEGIVQRLNALDPARAMDLRAQIAEAQKDYAGAEQDWHAKIAASQSSREAASQAWMDLGSFYRRRGRLDEMMAALKSGAAADADHGPALVDGASTLIAADRDPQLAAQWLREYINGNALSEDAPAFVVHARLGELLKKQGDNAGADREFAAAHVLSTGRAGAAQSGNGD